MGGIIPKINNIIIGLLLLVGLAAAAGGPWTVTNNITVSVIDVQNATNPTQGYCVGALGVGTLGNQQYFNITNTPGWQTTALGFSFNKTTGFYSSGIKNVLNASLSINASIATTSAHNGINVFANSSTAFWTSMAAALSDPSNTCPANYWGSATTMDNYSISTKQTISGTGYYTWNITNTTFLPRPYVPNMYRLGNSSWDTGSLNVYTGQFPSNNSAAYLTVTWNDTSDFYIKLYDEETGLPVIGNLKSTNSTQENTITFNSPVYLLNISEVTTGTAARISTIQPNYTERYFYYNAYANGNFSTDIYLLKTSSAIDHTLQVVDANAVPKANVFYTVQKFIGGSLRFITNGYTSTFGYSQNLKLKAGDSYVVTLNAPSGETLTATIYPSNTVYISQFAFNAIANNFTYTVPYVNTTWRLSPNIYFVGISTNITLNVSNPDGVLSFFSLTTWVNGTTPICYQNSTAPQGGLIGCYINFTNGTHIGGNYTVNVRIGENNVTPININFTYIKPSFQILGNATNVSIDNFLNNVINTPGAGPGQLQKGVIAIVTTLIGTAALSASLPVGSGPIALLLLAVWTSIGFFPIAVFIVIALIGIGLYINRVYQ